MDYAQAQDLPTLIEQLSADGCTPGWVRRPKPLLWPVARSAFQPAHWRWERMRPALLAACRLIGTDQAERRNLVLRNPAQGVDFATTNTLVGAYQAILPGEHARSHRHAPHALRVILEARGAYSVVNGERTPMETGDVVLTPGMHWHGHGHDGSEPALWFDCLDVPLVHLLEPMCFEEHPQGFEHDARRVEESPMRITAAAISARLNATEVSPSPAGGGLGWGPAAVDAGAGVAPLPASHQSGEERTAFGTCVDLSSPTLPTIGIRAHRWRAGWQGAAYTHTANSIHVVLGGSGRTQVGEQTFDWGFGDVIALPLGLRTRHEATADATVIALTDEPVMRMCGYYRIALG